MKPPPPVIISDLHKTCCCLFTPNSKEHLERPSLYSPAVCGVSKMPGGLDAGTFTWRHTCWWNLERCVTWPWEALGLCTGKYSACVSVHKELSLTIFTRCLPLWLLCFDGHSSAALRWPWVLGREMDVSERLNLFCFVVFLAGSACHTTTLPALVRTPTLMMQPSLDIKPFMSFPVDSSSAVGLFPNFNTVSKCIFIFLMPLYCNPPFCHDIPR